MKLTWFELSMVCATCIFCSGLIIFMLFVLPDMDDDKVCIDSENFTLMQDRAQQYIIQESAYYFPANEWTEIKFNRTGSYRSRKVWIQLSNISFNVTPYLDEKAMGDSR